VNIYTLAKYPFLSEAKELVHRENVRTEEILHDPIYQRARDIGRQRVIDALDQRAVGAYPVASETDALMNVFSYPIARMIVASVKHPFFRGRYALAEAKRAYEFLQQESAEFLGQVAKELNINVKENLSLHFTDYLRHAPSSSNKWKLVNMPLTQGWLRLQHRELARVLQNAIQQKLFEELRDLNPPAGVTNVFNEEVTAITNTLQQQEVKEKAEMGDASVAKLPPCIRMLLAAVQSGTNVPHVGRFTLVSFINAIGLDTEEILDLFAASPDFDRERSRYQVEHITGKVSGTDYTPPGCASIKTWGLCPTEKMDDICHRVKHPLSYYRIKGRKRK